MRVPRAGPLSTTNSAAQQTIGPFQAQIVIDQLRGLRSQGEKAHFAALAAHTELASGEQDIVAVQGYDFGRAETMHEH